ncbi:MAG: diguanylate cyclase [Cyanobacteria bacterium J06621_11]
MNIPNSQTVPGTIVLWQESAHSNELTPLTSTMCSKGYQLHVVESEYQAIKGIIEKQADLLIIHLRSAGSKGYELCEILRSQSANQYLPVIFVGFREKTSERIKALRCGGNEYLKLPTDSSEEGWLRIEQHINVAKKLQQLETDKTELSQKVSEYSHVLKQQEQLKVSLTKENQALHKLAFVDGLTQVANRRSFNQSIAQLWSEAGQKHQPLSLLLCDIDYFKRYNDTYGHLEGDHCLQLVAAALLRGANRFQDHVARYGGEEFAILLPGTDTEGAQQVAANIQSEILQIQVPHDSSLVAPWVSLSIGVCTMIPSAQQPYETLIQGSDEAMYAAKIRGRNRSVVNKLTKLVSIEPNYCLCNYKTSGDRTKKHWTTTSKSARALSERVLSERAARNQALSEQALSEQTLDVPSASKSSVAKVTDAASQTTVSATSSDKMFRYSDTGAITLTLAKANNA